MLTKQQKQAIGLILASETLSIDYNAGIGDGDNAISITVRLPRC